MDCVQISTAWLSLWSEKYRVITWYIGFTLSNLKCYVCFNI